MSWSLDPRRPDPAKDPEGWYTFWEEELAWCYSSSRLSTERARPDSEAHMYTQFLSDEHLHDKLQKQQRIAVSRQNLSGVFHTSFSKPVSFETRWTALGVAGRERAMVEALVYITLNFGVEDSWCYCPDITKPQLCAGKGEGFLKMVRHFVVSDLRTPPPIDFPILHETRFETIQGLPHEGAEPEFPRPAAIRAANDLVLAHRTDFIVWFALVVVCQVTNTPMSFENVRKSSTKQRAAEEQALKASSAFLRESLPSHVQELLKEKKAKDKAFIAKLAEHCHSCLKSSDHLKSKLLACSGCLEKVDRRITYCSRECQLKDYKHGNPPHKLICGKAMRSVDPVKLAEPSGAVDFPLYTDRPSSKLAIQLIYLRRYAHTGRGQYFYTQLESGLPLQKSFGDGAPIFEAIRRRAMAEQDLKGIAELEYFLHISIDPRSEETKEGWTAQLEAEYEVRMVDARKAATGSKVIKALQKSLGRMEIDYSKNPRHDGR